MTGLRLRLLTRHPLVTDAVLAVFVAVLAVASDAFGPDDISGSTALLWDVLLALPLVLRRRMPALASAAIGALCLTQWIIGDLAHGDLVVLIMLYTLGAWEQRRWLIGAAILIAELGVVMAVLKWAPAPHSWESGLLMTGTLTAALAIGAYVRTRRAYLASMLERAESAERDRDAQARIAVAGERARMAREMHDIIAHSLSVMITLNDAAVAIATTEPVRRTVTQASEVGRSAMTEMQRMLGVLRGGDDPDLAPQPGTAGLPDLVDIARSAGLSVQLTVTGNPVTLGPTVELTIYRIVQESLTNVLKHAANVSHVMVEVTLGTDGVSIRIQNDGDRATQSSEASGTGHGLAGMRERIGAYDGTLRAAPISAGGWLVTAQFTTSETTPTTHSGTTPHTARSQTDVSSSPDPMVTR